MDKNDRTRVTELRKGSVTLEIYEKKDHNTGKTYYDFTVSRSFFLDGELNFSKFLQQRDLRNLIVVAVEAMEFISLQHRRLRDNRNNGEYED